MMIGDGEKMGEEDSYSQTYYRCADVAKPVEGKKIKMRTKTVETDYLQLDENYGYKKVTTMKITYKFNKKVAIHH